MKGPSQSYENSLLYVRLHTCIFNQDYISHRSIIVHKCNRPVLLEHISFLSIPPSTFFNLYKSTAFWPARQYFFRKAKMFCDREEQFVFYAQTKNSLMWNNIQVARAAQCEECKQMHRLFLKEVLGSDNRCWKTLFYRSAFCFIPSVFLFAFFLYWKMISIGKFYESWT